MRVSRMNKKCIILPQTCVFANQSTFNAAVGQPNITIMTGVFLWNPKKLSQTIMHHWLPKDAFYSIFIVH